MEFTIDQGAWKRNTPRYVDVFGRDQHEYDTIVMEGSSKLAFEDLSHSIDDMIKNIHGSICILEAVLRRYHNAKLTTALNPLAFAIQSIRRTIALSTTSIYLEDPKTYVHEKCRPAEIPTNYRDRYNWLKVFELVCKLIIMLRKQNLIIE